MSVRTNMDCSLMGSLSCEIYLADFILCVEVASFLVFDV